MACTDFYLSNNITIQIDNKAHKRREKKIQIFSCLFLFDPIQNEETVW